MKVIVPPIKSQGIKTKLVPWILELAGKSFTRWIEPFLGTGVVAFNANPATAILNDTNPHIIKFYRNIQEGVITPESVREYLESEGKKLKDAGEGGYEHYRTVRDRFNADNAALDFLFLSRAGFNGMIRFNSKGNWNIPFCKKPNRFSPAYVTKIVNQVSAISAVMKPTWSFVAASFETIIPLAGSGDMIYCDPPYSGRYVDYYNGWDDSQEEALYQLLSATKSRFILSTWHHNEYRQNEMIDKYWKSFNIITKDHFYHGGGRLENRNTVVEALVCNFKCDLAGL